LFGITFSNLIFARRGGNFMAIVRLIYVKVNQSEADQAERMWKEHCAPLMIGQPGCLSEKLLRCTDNPGEFISYSEWDNQESIDKYRRSQAHEEIKRHAGNLQRERPTVKRYAVV
jgi:heme-degrading monooxygenase HmoA